MPESCNVIKCHDLYSSSFLLSLFFQHNTVKFLVAIAPNGMVCFLSDVWCGRASDRRITMESGFMDAIQNGDKVIMHNKLSF